MNNELYHHGIKGMRWGVRRFQNKDGSLTPAGEKRALKASKKLNKKLSDSFKALDEYEKTVEVQNVNNPYKKSGVSTFVISDIEKKKRYNEAVEKVNEYMDYLDKKGFEWKYDSNYSYDGKIDSGKSYVETTINGMKIRNEW